MTLKDSKLAINGGEPVRRDPFPRWPVWDESDVQAIGDYDGQAAAEALNLSGVRPYATGDGIRVAVIDGGVDYTHTLLSGHVLSGYDFVDLDGDAFDEPGGYASGHGTFVAGLVHLVAPAAEMTNPAVASRTEPTRWIERPASGATSMNEPAIGVMARARSTGPKPSTAVR